MYDEETEQLSEDLSTITGEIADLTKTANNPDGISIFTDENRDTYKSTFQILREISGIWDELTDKQQANLLETLFGKNRAQAGAAILKNFSQAEAAMNTMAESAGNAEKEMSTIVESLEYKINALKETGTGIWQNIFNRSDIAAVVDALTGILDVIDAVTEKLGLFGTVIARAGISGAFKSIS